MKQQVLFMIVVVCTWCSAYPQSILNDSIKEVIVVGSGGLEGEHRVYAATVVAASLHKTKRHELDL